jgi:transcription elongation GreA/GreB family factor
VDNVSRALHQENLPKAWSASIRELRTLFMDDEKFQKQLIDAANGDAMMFAAALQGALFLTSGERQSLMVKLARISPVLREYLETGAGQRILKAGIGVAEDKTPVEDEPNYTSIRSHQRLIEELNHLVNVLVPENREALKVARAHGDFRENSEFDAAKERRNFLSRRRSELERELAKIQPLTMTTVKVEDVAVIGSEIELTYENGDKDVYQLLGAWDGDPDRNFLAYSTRLGKTVLNQKKGSSFEVPGGRKCTLTAIRPLAPELAAELDQK